MLFGYQAADDVTTPIRRLDTSARSKPGERSIEIQTLGGAKNEVARSRSTSAKIFSGTGSAVTMFSQNLPYLR
jgi:hypothetical protein